MKKSLNALDARASKTLEKIEDVLLSDSIKDAEEDILIDIKTVIEDLKERITEWQEFKNYI